MKNWGRQANKGVARGIKLVGVMGSGNKGEQEMGTLGERDHFKVKFQQKKKVMAVKIWPRPMLVPHTSYENCKHCKGIGKDLLAGVQETSPSQASLVPVPHRLSAQDLAFPTYPGLSEEEADCTTKTCILSLHGEMRGPHSSL